MLRSILQIASIVAASASASTCGDVKAAYMDSTCCAADGGTPETPTPMSLLPAAIAGGTTMTATTVTTVPGVNVTAHSLASIGNAVYLTTSVGLKKLVGSALESVVDSSGNPLNTATKFLQAYNGKLYFVAASGATGVYVDYRNPSLASLVTDTAATFDGGLYEFDPSSSSILAVSTTNLRSALGGLTSPSSSDYALGGDGIPPWGGWDPRGGSVVDNKLRISCGHTDTVATVDLSATGTDKTATAIHVGSQDADGNFGSVPVDSFGYNGEVYHCLWYGTGVITTLGTTYATYSGEGPLGVKSFTGVWDPFSDAGRVVGAGLSVFGGYGGFGGFMMGPSINTCDVVTLPGGQTAILSAKSDLTAYHGTGTSYLGFYLPSMTTQQEAHADQSWPFAIGYTAAHGKAIGDSVFVSGDVYIIEATSTGGTMLDASLIKLSF